MSPIMGVKQINRPCTVNEISLWDIPVIYSNTYNKHFPSNINIKPDKYEKQAVYDVTTSDDDVIGNVEDFLDVLSISKVPMYAKVGELCEFRCDGRVSADRYSNIKTEIRGEQGDRHDLHISWDKEHVVIGFIPRTPGTHQIRVLESGVEVQGSPSYVLVTRPRMVKPSDFLGVRQYLNSSTLDDLSNLPKESIVIAGQGHIKGAKGRFQSFNICKFKDVLSIVIRNKHGIIEHKEQLTSSGGIRVTYIPDTPGLHYIHIRTARGHVTGSPFIANIVDVSKIRLLDDVTEWFDDKQRVLLEMDTVNILHYDTAGVKGAMSAEMIGPAGRLIPMVTKTGKTTVDITFTAHHQGDHYIYTYWDTVALHNSPILAYCPGVAANCVDETRVVVSNDGGFTAEVGVPAHFFVDGKYAGEGKLKVEIRGLRCTVPVDVTRKRCNRYHCEYTIKEAGNYVLYLMWDARMVPGCPYKLRVDPASDKRVVSSMTDKPGLGAVCEEYPLAKDILSAVPNSPSTKRPTHPTNPGMVQVSGAGIEDGLIDTYTSQFLVQTLGAGAGQLSVKVRGPRGGFRVKMQRCLEQNRSIRCSFSPTETGQYTITVRWSGVHVPNSPFNVLIHETMDDLLIWREKRKQIGWSNCGEKHRNVIM